MSSENTLTYKMIDTGPNLVTLSLINHDVVIAISHANDLSDSLRDWLALYRSLNYINIFATYNFKQ